MAGWSSGWVDTDGSTAVVNGATLNFTHNLGVADLIFTLYAADDNSGTNTIAIGVGSDLGNTGLTMAGAQIQSVSSTQVTLQLGSSGYNTLDSTGHRVNGSETNYLGKFIKVLALNPLVDPAPEPAGTEVKFIEPYDITPVDGAWTKIDAQPAWINSNARTLVVKAETFDFDTGGFTVQSLKARTSAASTIEVDIITHGGTSGGRSVASEQALIPCSEDGSFEYYWYRQNGNGQLRSFKVIGYVQRSPFIAGSGDLCKLFPDDSGYQMFRNGLTMQWMSSPAFTTETSQVINFPTPFATKPFKVVASARYPNNNAASTTFFQVASWNEAGVTVFAQAGAAVFDPVYADIIAIGITEAIGCLDTSAAAAGTKISELKSASELKDDDLFVLSREKDGDNHYDTSNNVSMSNLSEGIKTRMGPTLSTSSIISWTKAEGSSYINGVAGFTGDTLPDGTWVLLYFPWYSYDGGGEDDNAWYHQPPIIREEVKGFNIRTWMQSLGNASHFGGSNYTGHGIGFKISEDPV